jgi:hypothetical protein
MSSQRFDILFAGKILPGADPAEVRRQLKTIFKIGDEAADRLFSGTPVMVKRGADEATAERFREVFREAGALVRVTAAGGIEPPSAGAEAALEPTPEPAPEAAPSPTAGRSMPDTSHLQLAPPDDDSPLEPPVVADRLAWIDVSHLSLLGGDWTLADCEPPLPPIALPDISHLALVLPDDETGEASIFSRET